jgi:hypothetical protein
LPIELNTDGSASAAITIRDISAAVILTLAIDPG